MSERAGFCGGALAEWPAQECTRRNQRSHHAPRDEHRCEAGPADMQRKPSLADAPLALEWPNGHHSELQTRSGRLLPPVGNYDSGKGRRRGTLAGSALRRRSPHGHRAVRTPNLRAPPTSRRDLSRRCKEGFGGAPIWEGSKRRGGGGWACVCASGAASCNVRQTRAARGRHTPSTPISGQHVRATLGNHLNAGKPRC